MNPRYNQDTFWPLRRAGLREQEIARLAQLRRTYHMGEQDLPPLDLKRWHFARWLVAAGRLSEQLSAQPPAEAPHAPAWSWLKRLLGQRREA